MTFRWSKCRERDRALEEMWNRGEPGEAIAAKLGYADASAARRRARQLGLDPRRPYACDRDTRLVALWDAGVATKQIARALGYHDGYGVRRRAKALGLPSRESEPRPDAFSPPPITMDAVIAADEAFLTLLHTHHRKGAGEQVMRRR